MAARDILMIGVLIFAFAMGFFVLHFAMTSVVDQMIINPVINESAAAVENINVTATMVNRLDYVIFGLFIGLVLALIITGWFIGGVPIFMFIYFIVVIIAIVLSMVLSNVWSTVSEMSIFGNTITSFPITNNLLGNLPIYIAIVGIIGLVVMFAKPYVVDQE